MKSSYVALTWTVIFIILGFLNHQKIDEFSNTYLDRFNSIEENIKEDKWEQASYNIKDARMDLEKEKNIWYKLINHGYFNEIFAAIGVIEQSIYMEDKMITLQEIEKVKIVLENLMEDECYNLNRIF